MAGERLGIDDHRQRLLTSWFFESARRSLCTAPCRSGSAGRSGRPGQPPRYHRSGSRAASARRAGSPCPVPGAAAGIAADGAADDDVPGPTEGGGTPAIRDESTPGRCMRYQAPAASATTATVTNTAIAGTCDFLSAAGESGGAGAAYAAGVAGATAAIPAALAVGVAATLDGGMCATVASALEDVTRCGVEISVASADVATAPGIGSISGTAAARIALPIRARRWRSSARLATLFSSPRPSPEAPGR